MPKANKVAIAVGRGEGRYPATPPFRPGEDYPETAGRVRPGDEPNAAYALLRELFCQLGLDPDRVGTTSWNPLRGLVRPGDKVVIKPNLVRHQHASGGDYQAVVTHASVVRAIADYVGIALEGRGEIVIGDAPVQMTDFDTVVQRTGLEHVRNDIEQCWGVPVRLADFRLWALRGVVPNWSEGRGEKLAGDRDGYRAVDLGRDSMLSELPNGTGRFRVTCYNADTMREHHNEARHEYLVAGVVLNADVVINVPKLKTHRKVGLTAALKNLVGINGHKDWLPHHRSGSLQEGGDEYRSTWALKRMQTRLDEDVYRHPGAWSNRLRLFGIRALARVNRHLAPDPYYEGSWYGNDTCWRMVHDLNRLLLYADREGRMSTTTQRRVMTFVDAIVAGENDGPMRPDPRRCNLLVGGRSAAAVDAVLATMIGFDYRKLPLVARAFGIEPWPLADFEPDDVEVASNDGRFATLRVGHAFDALNFGAPSSWKGQVEFSKPLSSSRSRLESTAGRAQANRSGSR